MTIGPERLIREQTPQEPGFLTTLKSHGISVVLVTASADLEGLAGDDAPDLVLIGLDSMPEPEFMESVEQCSRLKLPVIALVPETRLADLSTTLGVDDFLLSPPNNEELLARSRRALSQTPSHDSEELIRVGDLAINTANYEVSLGGRRVNLRFKEYELLLLMATNPGRVYTREALLNRVWGYDYLGGTRTVDVHVRRLRSKIEDADHTFIETVWNVGYRFKDVEQTA